jgi:muramidase (phage lysozyme)
MPPAQEVEQHDPTRGQLRYDAVIQMLVVREPVERLDRGLLAEVVSRVRAVWTALDLDLSVPA